MRAYINGVMEEVMMVIGKKIKCMEKVFIPGKMGENMKESIFRIKNK